MVVDGLKDGLKELGFDAGKQYVLETADLGAATQPRTRQGVWNERKLTASAR